MGSVNQSQREWVWRSFLRGARLGLAINLAQLTEETTPQALQQVAHKYSTLMVHRRRKLLVQRDAHRGDAHIKEENAGQWVEGSARPPIATARPTPVKSRLCAAPYAGKRG
jgi:hypothetical protein